MCPPNFECKSLDLSIKERGYGVFDNLSEFQCGAKCCQLTNLLFLIHCYDCFSINLSETSQLMINLLLQ